MTDIELRKAESLWLFNEWIKSPLSVGFINERHVETIRELCEPSPPVPDNEVDYAFIDLEQFVHEVAHAQSVGSSWYTKGEAGLYGQVKLWREKAVKAISVLKKKQQPRQECPHNCPHCYAIDVRKSLTEPPKDKL